MSSQRVWIRIRRAPIVGGLALAVASAASAGILRVDDSGPTSGQTGADWDHPFTTIQAAMSAANSGDEIRVGQGTYKPSSQTTSIDLKAGVQLLGGFAGYGATDPNDRNPVAYVTILSGDLATTPNDSVTLSTDTPPQPLFTNYGDNSRTVLKVPSAVTPFITSGSTILPNVDGFTIRGGNSNNFGGGVFVDDNAQVYFRDCIIKENMTVFSGAGVYADTGSSIILRKCTVMLNRCPSGSSSASVGGGVFTNGTSKFLNSTIQNNVGQSGGGIWVHDDATTCSVICCTIDGNTATGGDTDNDGSGGGFGGWAGSVYLINSLFVNNHATAGGGSKSKGSTFTITNCTYSGNSADEHGGGHAEGPGTITNCIFWQNSAISHPEITPTGTTLTVNHSDVSGGWSGPGANNMNANPIYVGSGNYQLTCTSPCREMGDNGVLPLDVEDADEDGQTTSERTPDRILNYRVIGIVDMGAFEKTQEATCHAEDIAPPPCPDGVVNIRDLLRVIALYVGTCPDPDIAPCHGDVNSDGFVNANDLLAVIAKWGQNCQTPSGGSAPPESVEDCWDTCEAMYSDPEKFAECYGQCLDYLCEQSIIECE